MAITKLEKKKKLTKDELEAKKAILRIFVIYPDLMISKLSKQAENEGKLTRKSMFVSSSTTQPGFRDNFTKILEEAESKDEFNIYYNMTFGIKDITGKLIQEAEYEIKTNIKFENGVSKLTVHQDTGFKVKEEAQEKYEYLSKLIDEENKKIKTLSPDELVNYVNDLVFSLIPENTIN